jgi:hypothetical protein
VPDLKPSKIYYLIKQDFGDIWDTVANNPKQNLGRGNFMFGLLSMILLEFIGRALSSDSEKLRNFSQELHNIDNRYFVKLPGVCYKPKGFKLPWYQSDKGDELLWVVYDLIRNGEAHQYQQITVDLKDNKVWAICLRGPKSKRSLNVVRSERTSKHLTYYEKGNTIWLWFDPGTFFIHLTDAIIRANVNWDKLSFPYLKRGSDTSHHNGIPRKYNKSESREPYQFTSTDLKAAFEEGGIRRTNEYGCSVDR